MKRSYGASGAIALAGLLSFLLTQCGEPGSGATPSSDPTLPPAPPATAVETTTAPTTALATTTTAVAATTPATTAPPTPTTTTTTTTTTAPPSTPAPTTPPSTAAPTTAAPTTAAPTTAAPTTALPTTLPPTTAAPTTAAPTTQTPAPPSNPGATPSPDAVALTNQQRQAAGLAALATNGALTDAAAEHSQDQAGRNSMGHTGSDGSSAGDRISANGGSFSTWAENVAAGYGSARAVVDGWMNSPGHRDNILNPAMTQIGVAVAIADDGTPYWTMVLSG